MSDIVDIAAAILSSSENRLEVVAKNISNTGTPGFKAEALFSDMISETVSVGVQTTAPKSFTDFSQGKLSETGNSLDLAISGSGFFEISGNSETYLTRNGQFQLASDGRVTTAQGHTLRQVDGSDLILGSTSVEILPDGRVLEAGRPVGKISLVEMTSQDDLKTLGGSTFQAAPQHTTQVTTPLIRQGMVETANVTLSNEMMTMMEAIRQAETGARLVQTYDTLLGKAISTFGQGSQ